MISEMEHRTNQMSARLIRQLKHRDRRKAKIHRNYDIITAIIQASSLKRSKYNNFKISLQLALCMHKWQQQISEFLQHQLFTWFYQHIKLTLKSTAEMMTINLDFITHVSCYIVIHSKYLT